MKELSILSIIILVCVLWMSSCDHKTLDGPTVNDYYKEQHRPQYHFSPESGWMNDPNGMVYYDGEYHLFYQYYPNGIQWDTMHWGHAVSTDMLHWEHLPIAIYPDELGYIFSGSAVIDHKNTSGLGTTGVPPMIAIFTHHNMEGERSGRNDYQVQSIAYSLDGGRTFTKYDGNPVVENPELRTSEILRSFGMNLTMYGLWFSQHMIR
jgi:fructan beta-fructosidase